MKNILIALFIIASTGCALDTVNGVTLEFAFDATDEQRQDARVYLQETIQHLGGSYQGVTVTLYDEWDPIGERYAGERWMSEIPCIGGYYSGGTIRSTPLALAHELVHHDVSKRPKRWALPPVGEDNKDLSERQDRVHSLEGGWLPEDDERIAWVWEQTDHLKPWIANGCSE